MIPKNKDTCVLAYLTPIIFNPNFISINPKVEIKNKQSNN